MLRITSPVAVLLVITAAACAAPASSSGGADSNQDAKKSDKGSDKGTSGGDNAAGADPTKNPTQPPDEQGPPEGLWPEEVFTGATGGAQVYRAPISAFLQDTKGDVKWESADPSIATVEATTWKPAEFERDPFLWAIITAKKAGSTTITLTQGTKKLTAKVNVSGYTEADYTTGQQRYKTGGTEANRVACASCHEKPDGWDHSPTWTDALPDTEILRGIQDSEYHWGDGANAEKDVLKDGTHKWNLTDAEKKGIVAFLRGLNPKGLQQ